MLEVVHPYLAHASKRGALVDGNLLTVLLVGMLGRGEVEKFKRTREYTSEDAVGIDNLLSKFAWVCTTPHVLAEVANILDWVKGDNRNKVLDFLSIFVQNISEHHQPAKDLVETKVYFQLGLSDAGLVNLSASENLVLITADLHLYQYASGLGVQAINFHNLREAWLI
ncbi:PIN domain-containing protein [Desulfonatronum thiodismutans]|uniref:PIN domain-containing protein n=1 Tax=Desulfonatronum thiodismutans TaxID=159290 RepID=UPI0004ABD348|nr:PIN domain-containing protein [Desulfonatronum thiodismutans]